MADMTYTQVSDLRVDLADVERAFTDAELQRFWTRCSDADNDTLRFTATKGLAILTLLHDVAKFANYTAGKTSEQKAQIFDHYMLLYDRFYKRAVENVTGTAQRQVYMAVRGEMTHGTRTEPHDA